jgi:conjugal transfer pilus assembly protein TraE
MNEQDYAQSKFKKWLRVGADRIIAGLSLLVALGVVSEKLINGIQIREILLPPEISRPMWVSNNGQVSAEYLEDMGLFIIQLVMNTTPVSVDYQSKMLKKYVCAEGYGSIDTLIRNNTEKLKRDSATTVFSPRTVLSDPTSGRVTMTGNLSVLIGDRRMSDEGKTFVLDFGNLSSKLCVKGLYEQKPNQPAAAANGNSASDSRNGTNANTATGTNQ